MKNAPKSIDANAIKFDKELFKTNVKDYVRNLFRKTLEEATPQQVFQAVSYAIKESFKTFRTSGIIEYYCKTTMTAKCTFI